MYKLERASTFAQRLNNALDVIGAPVRGRAAYIKKRLPFSITVVGINKWLNGNSLPDTKKLSDIAVISNTSIENLLGINNIQQQKLIQKRVPLLSTVQAGNWAKSLTYTDLGDDIEWQYTGAKISADTFAVRVKGSSMTNPSGFPSLPEGSIVIVQPYSDPDDGKIVVAMLNGSKEATVKKLEKEGPYKYLIPLNPKFDPIPINGNCRIIGYVKEVIMRLD
ncbi:LexA family protein [Candidatus Enterovibrio escicola]|uniref:LexA family protein n=1 Tax=Candidatus Enterovibrio escicola TaxID=1927127 RepID=UPI001CC28816|nr:S24 family peptidase [Candidatus Enterovibrio escacola]